MSPPPRPLRYVALGDSTGAGVGSRTGGGYPERIIRRLRQQNPDVTMLNLCVSRAESANVLRSQVPRVASATPTLVTVGVGINDVTHGVALEDYAANMKTIIEALLATGAGVVVSNLPDVSYAPVVPVFLKDNIRSLLQAFNASLADVVAGTPVVLADAFTPSTRLMSQRPELFSDDGFHPSDAGYEVWADELWPYVQQALMA